MKKSRTSNDDDVEGLSSLKNLNNEHQMTKRNTISNITCIVITLNPATNYSEILPSLPPSLESSAENKQGH